MANHEEFTVSFIGRPGDIRDKAVEAIVMQYEGTIIGSGTFLPTSERDVQIRCARTYVTPLKDALRMAGVRVDGDQRA